MAAGSGDASPSTPDNPSQEANEENDEVLAFNFVAFFACVSTAQTGSLISIPTIESSQRKKRTYAPKRTPKTARPPGRREPKSRPKQMR
eukprot:scaffold3422_cov28-Tisochrysis_lutea.AAC.5